MLPSPLCDLTERSRRPLFCYHPVRGHRLRGQTLRLVRIQGLTQPETAEVLGVSMKTMQRRLRRALVLLTEQFADLRPTETPPEGE
jgi:hypothetical protein